jgi:hypothetical protein
MSHLVRWDAKKGATFVHALRLDLDKETTERVGRAYGIITADAKGRHAEALAAHLEDAFTRGAAEAVRKLSGDAPQDQLFEAAISRTNHALNRLFGENGLDIEPERVSAAIVAIKDHDMVASTWGGPSMLLFHPLPNDTARTFDLVDDSNADQAGYKTANARRCFGSIIAGRMGKRDRLLIASQDLRHSLGDDALTSAILDHEPSEATSRLNRLLSPRDEMLTVALLVLDVAEIRYLENEPALAVGALHPAGSKTSASIAQLLKTQSETGETMAPSIMSGIGKKMTDMLRRDDGRTTDPQKRTASLPSADSRMPEKPASMKAASAPAPERTLVGTVLTMAAKLLKAVGKGLLSILSGIGTFLLAMLSKEKRTARISDLRQNTDNFMNGMVDRFNGFNKLSKAMVLAALLLIFVAKGELLASSWNKAKDDQFAAYEQQLTSIQQKIDSAEASAIYHDEARATTLLAEATAAVAALPNAKPTEKNTKESLTAKIAAARGSLRREVKVGQPDILASITSAGGAAALAKMTSTDDTLWIASSTGEVYHVATSGGAAEKAGDVPGGASPAVFITQGKDVYAASSAGTGALITLAGKKNDVPVDFATSQTVPVDAGLYNSRLYVLDPSHNRITRHLAEAKDFGKPQFYLKDGTDLSSAVSMAIDGGVWVLNKDGNIVHVVKGLQSPFTVSPADPPVSSAVRIRTNVDSDLFVLDTNPARILRYDKRMGTLVAQYVNESLVGATDFTIDAKGTTAYVSKGNQVLRFALPDVK